MSNATVSDSFNSMNMNASSSPSSSNFSFFGYIQSISLNTWLIVFLVLTLLGFNVFAVLAKGTQSINEIFGPLFRKLLGILGLTASETVDIAASGIKNVVNTTAEVTDAGLTTVQNALPTNNGTINLPLNAGLNIGPNALAPNAIGPNANALGPGQPDISTANRALNTQKASAIGSTNGYQEDDSTSNIQMGSGKSGYCYIGEDRGYRSCAYVNEGDSCISGEIFPTNEICINPNLRT